MLKAFSSVKAEGHLYCRETNCCLYRIFVTQIFNMLDKWLIWRKTLKLKERKNHEVIRQTNNF